MHTYMTKSIRKLNNTLVCNFIWNREGTGHETGARSGNRKFNDWVQKEDFFSSELSRHLGEPSLTHFLF